jgi:hypothetical protein
LSIGFFSVKSAWACLALTPGHLMEHSAVLVIRLALPLSIDSKITDLVKKLEKLCQNSFCAVELSVFKTCLVVCTPCWVRKIVRDGNAMAALLRFAFGRCACFGSVGGQQVRFSTAKPTARHSHLSLPRILSKSHFKHRMTPNESAVIS